MYRSGLLLLTSPLRSLIEAIGNNLLLASKTVRNRLYVSLEPGRRNLWPALKKRSSSHDLASVAKLLPAIYMKASSICRDLDIRVVLSPREKSPSTTNFDVVLTDSTDTDSNIGKYVHHQFRQPCSNVTRLEGSDRTGRDSQNGFEEEEGHDEESFKTYDTVVLGGTFDRLHNGHKVLLSCSVLRARKRVIVGVTDGKMLAKKSLFELIEPVNKRIDAVKEFLEDINSTLQYSIVPINDPFGPSIVDPNIDCIVVSEETKRGGDLVNTERETRNMNKLDMVVINLLEEPYLEAGDEAKVSSSNKRRALLGSYLKKPEVNKNRQAALRIALRGDIQDTKSLIGEYLEKFGATVIDCDELMLSSIKSKKLLMLNLDSATCSEFICDLNQESMKKLDVSILKEKSSWEKIAAILLPDFKSAIDRKIEELEKKNVPLVFVKMPAFADNSYLDNVDQVWSAITLDSEYEEYLRTCHSLSEEVVQEITKSQRPKAAVVAKSHVVFCRQGDDDILRKQVQKAWDQLQDLMARERTKPYRS